MSGNVNIKDLENTLPSWISDHLGERSYMDTSFPKKDSSGNEGSPLIDIRPSSEREVNIMTQGKLDRLRESCSFLGGIQIRLLEANETIVSTRLGKVAFYEVAFQAGLRLPIHPTLRRILAHYNIYPA